MAFQQKDTKHTYEIKELGRILSAIEAIPQLPDTGSQEYYEMGHAAWMERSQTLCKLYERAQNVALLALPQPVDKVFQQIRKEKYKHYMPAITREKIENDEKEEG